MLTPRPVFVLVESPWAEEDGVGVADTVVIEGMGRLDVVVVFVTAADAAATEDKLVLIVLMKAAFATSPGGAKRATGTPLIV
jgi:hypothetical protein